MYKKNEWPPNLYVSKNEKKMYVEYNKASLFFVFVCIVDSKYVCT